uniref:Uncharacterized protein n=1 Tax=Amorphochlora amoebiformis TaxID=1561963 RepID=A0A7S0DEU6_9EUKA|mmetsp:Transcript_25230/g.39854  ORF Transcript_25230/g.39854 Transcript_25230/m.39854 type:complete len:120 (+) Transcript_25230:312-671(+)
MDLGIAKDILKDRKTHIDQRVTQLEKELLDVRSAILNKTEILLKLKARKLRLMSDPVALKIAELQREEEAAVCVQDYLKAHSIREQIQTLEPKMQDNGVVDDIWRGQNGTMIKTKLGIY